MQLGKFYHKFIWQHLQLTFNHKIRSDIYLLPKLKPDF